MKAICPHCKQEFPETPDKYLGMTLECPVCQKEFVCEKPKFCSECGAVNPAKALKCAQCGKSFLEIPQHPVPPPNYNQHSQYDTATDDSNKLPVMYLLGKLVKYTFIAIIAAGIGYAAWYNLPSSKKKRAEKVAELARIQNTYMVNHGETDAFRKEVKRLHDKFAYEKFGPRATRQDCIDSVKKIVTNWNIAVSAFKNADKKKFTDIDALVMTYAMLGLNAYHVSKDYDLPSRIVLIQKSQAEAAEIGKKIYEAVQSDDVEEKKRLLEEYNRLINQGNLN